MADHKQISADAVPDEVIQAAEVVSKWAAENSSQAWVISGCASRFFYDLLLDMLAVVHRDGGQHTAERGIAESMNDALMWISAMHWRGMITEFGCWEPMNSAPRDMPVLIRTDAGEVFVAQWSTHPITDDVAWRIAVFGDEGECLIVHDPVAWHPVPLFRPRPDAPDVSTAGDVSALDSYHWHEVCDRAHCIREMVNSMLAEHKAVMLTPSLRLLVSVVDRVLGEVYQEAGRRYG